MVGEKEGGFEIAVAGCGWGGGSEEDIYAHSGVVARIAMGASLAQNYNNGSKWKLPPSTLYEFECVIMCVIMCVIEGSTITTPSSI